MSEKTIPEMLREYNALAAQAIGLGLAYRERKCFKDRSDAVRSMEAIGSSLRAAKGSEMAAPPAADAAPAASEEEAPVAKKEKTKSVPKAKAANGKNGGPRKGSKTEGIHKLLTRAKGCTAAEVRELTGWPSVSMPAMAKACGLKLRRDKVKGASTQYFGE